MPTEQINEVLHNLLVVLRGQIPSLQFKKTAGELTTAVQALITNLRQTITQVEALADADPSEDPRFAEILRERDALKRTCQKLEEALFSEMDKAQRAGDELARLRQKLDETVRTQEQAQRALSESETRAAKTQDELAMLVARSRRIEEDWKQAREQLEKTRSQVAGEPVAALKNEIQLLKANVATREQERDAATKALREEIDRRERADRELALFKGRQEQRAQQATDAVAELAVTKTKHEAAEKHAVELRATIAATQERVNTLNAQLAAAQAEVHDLKDRATRERARADALAASAVNSKPVVEIRDTEKTLTRVRELETELATVRQQMKSVTIGDAVVNLEQSYRSRVAYLEHALAQAQQTIRLQESRLSAPSPARELLEAEKKQLLVRCYDLEATVTRQQMRIKSLEEQHAGHSRTSTPDEGLKLMEILCTTNARLSDRPEFKDLARQLTEGIELLGAIHTITPIPTLGHPLVDDLHRVARVFFSTLLDDNTIVYEAAKGYRIGDRVYQKSVVWSVKQKFSCPACKMLARPQDNFCLKCGQEITASDGTPRRKLAPLPAEVEVFLPLVDTLTMQGQFDKAARLLDYLTQERPDHPAAEQRRRQLEKLQPRTEPQPE